MRAERCVRWEPVSDIECPCGDITFAYDGPGQLSVTMHMTDHSPSDLRLIFSGAISMRWEEESFGLNPLPDPLPQIGSGPQPRWTFPLLRVEDSTWLATHAARETPLATGRCHFALVALNDLLQILAFPDVEAAWVDAPRNT